MAYKRGPENISNVEFTLLQLIAENNSISGYEINRLIEERGYREWANIGTTSIYTGLDRLKRRMLVDSQIDIKKRGKGPLPKRFTLTAEGTRTLRATILEGLSSTRERDQLFDLAIAALPLISHQEAIDSLRNRTVFLANEKERLEEIFQAQGGNRLPFFVKALFRHPANLITAEIDFTNQLIIELNNLKEGD